MNYYERYCGDYQRDTAHLSLMEHGAYTQLLDHYYATEMPLPAEMARLYRVCRAVQPDELAAVDFVATQFFPVGDDGNRHNPRADAEIQKARGRIETARNNGKAGGRPPKPKPPDNPAAHPPGNPPDNPPGSPAGSPEETHRQSSPHATRHASVLTDGTRASAAGLACKAMKAVGVSDVNPSDIELANLMADGVTPQQMGDLATELGAATGKGVRARYVIRTMRGRLNDAGSQPRPRSRHEASDDIYAGAK